MIFFIRIFFIVLLTPCVLFAQSNSNITKAISTFVSDAALSNASISISILDANTGAWIGSYNPNLSLIPASSMKVVTTGAGLGILSPSYVFKTEIQHDGVFDTNTGVLTGNLFLTGYGDPTLGSDQLKNNPSLLDVMSLFGDVVDKMNLCTINGRVIGDASYFNTYDAIGTDWQWEDIGNYYGAGAFALNIHENFYYLNFQQNATIGASPRIVGTTPYVPELTFTNKVLSASGGGDNTNVFTAPLSDESIVRGTIPAGTGTFKIKGAMPNPPFTAATYFHNILKNKYATSIKKSPANLEDLGTPPRGNRQTLYTYFSPTLSRIVEQANQESNNLYVECILRAIAKSQNEDGNPYKGCEIVTNYWKNKGIDMNGFFMEDGSGLSTRNGVTSRQMASMLYFLNNDKSVNNAFYASLPKAGETGTLKNMFKGTKAIGKLRAKSGSMTRVRSYTGYVDRANGARWSFAIIVNNYNCTGGEMRQKLENFMASLCD